MSWDRVIQDSDDEDELAADILPPPKPVQHAPVRTDATEDESAGANQQIAINFDEFLQSQEAAQTRLSSSQQRREERWIPMTGDGGRSESIGTMMTEIGLAQRRLLDEEDSNQQQGLPRTVSAPISNLEPLVPVTDAQTMCQDDNGVYYSNYGHGHTGLSHEQADVNYHSTVQYTNGHECNGCAEVAQPDPHAQQQQTTFSSSYSGPSDNLFESSLRPSTTSYSNQINNPFTNHNATTDTELLHVSSPHDTEPNSSIIRARNDIAAELQQPQPPPQGSIDELSAPAPITVEIPQPPVPEKKRGRPKKHSLPDTDGEDELAQPRTTTATTTTPGQPEKRRPGRPPKSAKKDVEDPLPSDVHNQPEVLLPLPSDLTNGDNVTLNPDDKQPPKTIDSPTVDTATANPTAKAPRKKKVKRSKTTSVTLKKSYESDVEDDVIWIDERPVTNAPMDEDESFKVDTTKIPLLEKHVTNNNTNDHPLQPDAAPAPKKRGRKRKKTAEEPAPAEEAPINQVQIQDPEPDPTSLPNDLQQNPTTEDNDPPTIPDQVPEPEENQQPPSTPQKAEPQPHTPEAASSGKGAAKQHSPISTTSKVPYRVGLSRRARIAPLLKIVRR